MPCYVYASLRKRDSYLWLAARDGFDVMPESLSLMLGELRFVMEVQLNEQRKLPNEDTKQVIEHLRSQGWHLQLPPNETLATANHPDYRHHVRDDHDDDRDE
ncbi:MAG: YcgL domain-containing protein [Rhodanobacter sp.]